LQKFICNSKINTSFAFVVIRRHIHSPNSKKFYSPNTHMHAAKGDLNQMVLCSGFSSYTTKKVPLSIECLVPHFSLFLCLLFLCVLVLLLLGLN
jgi:hypothetical protein